MIEKRFGKEINEELQQALIQKGYDEALSKENLKVLDLGTPEEVSMGDDGFQFSVELTLAPELVLPDYKKISVKVPPADVPDEDLKNQLEELRQRYADFEDVEGRGIETGDFAVIDYSSTVEGKPTEEFLGKSAGYLAGREGFWLKVDEASFLPGYCAELEGLTAGDEKEITIPIPEDFPVADLHGKEITFATKVNEVKTAILPDLDDEFAGRLSPGKNLKELTEIITENMQQERKKKIEEMKVNQIVDYLNGLVQVDLPENLVLQETQSQADQMVQKGMQQGMSEEEIESQQEELFATAQRQAVLNLKTNFILQEIAQAEGIEVSDSDLVNHLAQVATSRKEAPKKFIREMSRSGQLPSVRNSLLIGKAIDFVVSEADVEEVAETAEASES